MVSQAEDGLLTTPGGRWDQRKFRAYILCSIGVQWDGAGSWGAYIGQISRYVAGWSTKIPDGGPRLV